MGWRARNGASGGRKRVSAKRRAASDLPPFDIPDSFYQDNVHLYNVHERPRLPRPLETDQVFPKVSDLHSLSSSQDRQRIEAYFSEALALLDIAPAMDQPPIENLPKDNAQWIEHHLNRIGHWIDGAWHLADVLYPAREAEYTYLSRPFWWWNIHKDSRAGGDVYPFGARQQPLQEVIEAVRSRPDFNYAQALPDLPVKMCEGLSQMVSRDLKSSAPDTFDPKTGKRPINIFSIQGHGGKSIAESFGRFVGWNSGANVIHIDAFDISWLVGRYIGQDWLYARGPVSTLGFRAAELSGRLGKFMVTERRRDDGDDDGDQVFHVRNAADLRRLRNEIEDDVSDTVSSVRHHGNGIFSDWENLKINKALDALISEPVRGGKWPVLIHVHDYVEMSMTLEGSAILAKLRNRIDTAWAGGKQIAMMGTSSSKTPSEEYQNMIKELSASDIVASRVVDPDSFPEPTHPGQRNRFNLELMDQLAENARNINRMLQVIDPSMEDSPENLWDPYDTRTDYWRHPECYQPTPWNSPPSLQKNFYTSATLPWVECYSVAKAWLAEGSFMREGEGLRERAQMGPLLQNMGQGQPIVINMGSMGPVGSGSPGDKTPGFEGLFERIRGQHEDDGQQERRAPNVDLKNANEYEKRIAGGVIQRDSLRVTFGDVHVPPETKSSLKLLTSLALVRPDAFSYGILAMDKINGCLLYGPPGTGKTMLAKAVAKDSGANMLEVSGASIHDKWVGESEKLIRAVFSLAKKLSPCVIFIDEGDAILGKRSTDSSRGSHRETLNQFLKEWDGMEETNAFIMVATNRPFDLDEAVLRRLPRKLLVDLPLKDDRAAILKLLLRDEQVAPDVDFNDFANRTPFYSGSDLKNLCVSAAMTAVEEENAAQAAHTGSEPYEFPEKRTLQKAHFEKALKQIPASISEDMDTLKMIKKFDSEYGKGRKGGAKKSMGFGTAKPSKAVDVDAAARVRSGDQPETGA